MYICGHGPLITAEPLSLLGVLWSIINSGVFQVFHGNRVKGIRGLNCDLHNLISTATTSQWSFSGNDHFSAIDCDQVVLRGRRHVSLTGHVCFLQYNNNYNRSLIDWKYSWKWWDKNVGHGCWPGFCVNKGESSKWLVGKKWDSY